MIVKVVKEMKISVYNSNEEYQILMILDALGIHYTINEYSEYGVKTIRVNLKEM